MYWRLRNGIGDPMQLFYCISERATRKSADSVRFGDINWMPTGKFLPSRSTVPEGIEIDGTPVKFAGAEKTSSRYIETGSAFSPILKAGPGDVGVAIKVTFLNAALTSS